MQLHLAIAMLSRGVSLAQLLLGVRSLFRKVSIGVGSANCENLCEADIQQSTLQGA